MSNFTYVQPAGRSKEIRHIHDFNVKKLVLTIIISTLLEQRCIKA